MTPHKAVLGVDAFEFDAAVGTRISTDVNLDVEGNLGGSSATLHRSLWSKGTGARMTAAKEYNNSVAGAEYEVGDCVMVYQPKMEREIGRKLRNP